MFFNIPNYQSFIFYSNDTYQRALSVFRSRGIVISSDNPNENRVSVQQNQVNYARELLITVLNLSWDTRFASYADCKKEYLKLSEKFWVCWVPYSGNPNVRHKSYEDAEKESRRLAASTNQEVFILEAVGASKKMSVESRRF